MINPTSVLKRQFNGKILILGFGCVASSCLPVFFDNITNDSSRYYIISKDSEFWHIADQYGISYQETEITKDNYVQVLNDFGLNSGDFVINLTVDVSSKAVLEYCNSHDVLYLDTCIEPWAGYYSDDKVTNAEKSNFALRQDMISLKPKLKNTSTAVVAHGANPGLVNYFVKRALLELAEIQNKSFKEPITQDDWALLAYNLGVKTIQISERDTQYTNIPKERNTFFNTWSIPGFISEGIFQPAELGWGTHEKELPARGEYHINGYHPSIYINQPGASVKVRGWTPQEGPYHGFLITHNESISIADYFTLRNNANQIIYLPTVFYCYHPCDAAVLSMYEILGKNSEEQNNHHLMIEDIVSGNDELGVLLLGDFGDGNTGYWHGSNLSVETARSLAKFNSATSLQVVAGVLAAFVWAIENPNKGLVEADDIDHKRILEIADPYLGEIVSTLTKWSPTNKVNAIINEDMDLSDKFQFKNFQVKF
jgi:homospermidine synthase